MRYLVASLMLLAFVCSANAQWINPEEFHWGLDCTEWWTYADPYTQAEMIWDPLATSPCGTVGWYRICGTTLWAPPYVTIGLFVELETEFHLDWTKAQFHESTYYEDIWYVLGGYIKSNNPSRIVIHQYDSVPLNFMVHQLTVVCNVDGSIPVYYYYKLVETDPWTPMTQGQVCPPPENWYFEVPLCDQNFWIGIKADQVYHQPDGYYQGKFSVCTFPIC